MAGRVPHCHPQIGLQNENWPKKRLYNAHRKRDTLKYLHYRNIIVLLHITPLQQYRDHIAKC